MYSLEDNRRVGLIVHYWIVTEFRKLDNSRVTWMNFGTFLCPPVASVALHWATQFCPRLGRFRRLLCILSNIRSRPYRGDPRPFIRKVSLHLQCSPPAPCESAHVCNTFAWSGWRVLFPFKGRWFVESQNSPTKDVESAAKATVPLVARVWLAWSKEVYCTHGLPTALYEHYTRTDW